MAEYHTILAGVSVSLDTDMGDGASGCWLESGGASASLEAADALGGLERDNGSRVMIPARTLAAIRQWAEARGY